MGVGDSPEQVAGRLGDGFLEDTTRSTMRRDYGIVEFFWSRRTNRDPWLSAGFAVQVHRLATAPEVADGPWGRLGRRVRFAALRAALDRMGFQCTEITARADQPGYRQYWLEEALVSITVARVSWQGFLKAGDVWSIQAPHTATTVAGARMRHRHQSMRDGLEHMIRLDDTGRRAWLDRRQPDPPDRVNWWLYLMLVIDGRLRDQPASRPHWVDLRVWLLHEAQGRAVFSRVRCAADMAYFVLAMRHAGAVASSLPSAEDVVRACLDAIPVPPQQAVGRDTDGNLVTSDRAVMQPSRQTRNLLSAAQWHLEALSDEELASRLQEWMTIRHLLV
jgi:hypothetical protein